MKAKDPVLVLLVAVLAGGLLWLIAFGLDYRAHLDLCVEVGLAVGLTWRLARLVVPPQVAATDHAPDSEPADDGLLTLTSLESRLSWGAADPQRFRDRVRPDLVALATDLLRTRRGVDPRTHPEPARQILGEPLWQLMTRPPERSPSRAELTRLVAALEQI
jgi:hypothetical protein